VEVRFKYARFLFILFNLFHLLNIKQGPISLVSAIEELLERKISGSGLENWDCGRIHRAD
jgi:hypothetical protein